MAWTYSLANINSSALSWVRLRIGDNTSADQLMQDEEILGIVTDMGGDQYFGAARCARQVSAHFARRVDKTAGRLHMAAAQASQHYEELAQRLEMEAAFHVTPYAGGISVNDKQTVNADMDRVKPAFGIGFMDIPGSNQISTTS